LMGAEAKNYLAEASRAPFENQLAQAQARQTNFQTDNPLLQAGNIGQMMWAMQHMPNQNGATGQPGFDTTSLIRKMVDPQYQMQLAAQQKGLEAQASSGVDQWVKNQNDAQTAADSAQTAQNYAKEFVTNYDNSKWKGPGEGTIDPKSWTAKAIGSATGHDWSPENQTDAASGNLIGAIGKAMTGGRITNVELTNWLNNVKPNRAMDPDAAHNVSDIVSAVSQRALEKPAFLSYMRQNLRPQDAPLADVAWNNYNQNQFPYDFQNNKTIPKNANGWKSFADDVIEKSRNGEPIYSNSPVMGLSQALKTPQSGSGNQNSIAIPKFNNSAEFKSWFRTLDPTTKSMVLSQLGSK
jgi:hypothetical protein